MKWDLIIYENMTESGPCTRQVADSKAMGGSDYAIVQLAEGMAARGKRVLVLSRNSAAAEAAGVTYYPADYGVDESCDVLLVSRKSCPTRHRADRVLISATDVGWGGTHMRGVPIIACSEWHRRTFLSRDYPDVRVINSMIDDSAYESDGEERNPDSYVYASAARKGLEPTLGVWSVLKQQHVMRSARLIVTTPGYDPVDEVAVQQAGAIYIGDLPPGRLQKLFRQVAGLFYVNIFPETFCAVAALAEAAGARAHVLCLNDPGALPEVTTGQWLTSIPDVFGEELMRAHSQGTANVVSRDFRRSKGLDAWEKTLWG